MLFHFLGFALLEYCLFSLVCANPMKEYLKIAGDATLASGSGPSSSPPRKAHPFRFSPYQKQQDPIPGTFRCPNGQSIDEKAINNLMADLCHMSIPELLSKDIKVEKIIVKNPNNPNNPNNLFDTYVYPINSDGTIVQQLASKEKIETPTKYEIIINQNKTPPFKCSLAGVYFKPKKEKLYCVYIPQLKKPLNPVIFQKEGDSVFDCNGEQFKLRQVYLSMVAAKKALDEQLIGLQLSLHPKYKKGFPHSFESGIFAAEDLWMFPIIPGADSVYIEGDPGIYSVIITGKGRPVGVVYLKPEEQYAQDIARKGKWSSMENISRFGVCKVKDYISLD